MKTPQFLSRLAQERPDLLIVVAYGRIFPREVLELPPLGAVNIHFSLLPRYRGAAPVQWAIAEGETETGVTVMKMSEEMDAGPILAQERVPILEQERSPSLGARLAPIGAQLLVSLLDDIDEKRVEPRAQDAGAATLAPLLRAEDGWVDWDLEAAAIARRIRAFDPWPGQSATGSKGKARIVEAAGREAVASDDPAAARPTEPGTVLGTRGRGPRDRVRSGNRPRGDPHPARRPKGHPRRGGGPRPLPAPGGPLRAGPFATIDGSAR